MQPADISPRGRRGQFASILAMALAVLWAAAAQAQTIVTVYSFSGSDGSSPRTALTPATGLFFGTTSHGGANSSSCGGSGCGTVFTLTLSGTLTTLYSFSGPDGAQPSALTLGTDGNYYGTTAAGGANSGACPITASGCGTVFQITPAGALNTIYNFSGPDGAQPSSLILGSGGNLYGTTAFGGANGVGSKCPLPSEGCGTVFEITTAGALTTLHSFGGPDGWEPFAALTLGGDGNFYGTTYEGGAGGGSCPSPVGGCGTVFKMTPAGVVSTLHSFVVTDGSEPYAALTLGSPGNLYGTTFEGGTSTSCPNGAAGCGTIFTITLAGAFTTLYTFNGPDGQSPNAALALGRDGNLYGTTPSGGNTTGDGTVFSIPPTGGAGTLATLYTFSGPDGAIPSAPLAPGSDGKLYGTTYDGGAAGAGSVFRVNCAPGGLVCTSTSLSSSLNPSGYGEPVTFTATVIPASGTNKPTGSVSFTDNGNSLGVFTLSNGTASVTPGTLALGQHSIAASYSGDPNFQPSVGNLLQTVNQATTTTALVSSLNPSVYDEAVTFTATVTTTAGSGTPTGTVVFTEGGRTLGTVNLSSGVATLTPVVQAGTHTISAAYSGDTNHASSSGSVSQVVTQATTTLTLQSNANPVLVNKSVTFIGTVTGQFGGFPTGTLTFSSNGVQIGSPVTVAGGKAKIETSFASAGTYSITAVYSGDANFVGSHATPLNETVDSNEPTNTSLKSSNSHAAFGTAVTFTATVRASSGSIPNGETVTFLDGTAAIGTGKTSSGVATFTTSSLAVGTHSITASYPGDATFSASTSAPLQEMIVRDSTATALTSSVNPSTYGQSVTFTAKVTSSVGTPTGTVTFENGSTKLGQGTLSGGSTTFTWATLPAGTNSMTATYNGDPTHLTSTSPALIQTVEKAATTTKVSSSNNPSNPGQSVTFTATVTSEFATPVGQVTFKQGTTTIGTATLQAGVAKVTTSTLAAGADQITATYAGNTDFLGSSGSITQNVN